MHDCPGVTGARTELEDRVEGLIELLHEVSDIPVAVGFGVSSAKQVCLERCSRIRDLPLVNCTVNNMASHAWYCTMNTPYTLLPSLHAWVC